MKTQTRTNVGTIRDIAAAEAAIENAEIGATARKAAIETIYVAFDGGTTGIDAWAEPATFVSMYGTRSQIETFWDLVASIDLDAIAAEGKSVSIGGDA